MNNETLLHAIEKLRKEMVAVGLNQGFTSEETIELSKHLDFLINIQMKVTQKVG